MKPFFPRFQVVSLVLVCLMLSLGVGVDSALAHKPSDSYLTLDLNQPQLALRTDIALRDLELAVGLDQNGDGQITWGEVKLRAEAATAYLFSRLQLTVDGQPCQPVVGTTRIVDHSDGAYLSLGLTSACALTADSQVSVNYQLLFDQDPTHRGLLRVVQDGGEQLHILSPQQPSRDLSTPSSGWHVLREYTGLGVWHIWIGYDHIAFLVTLLLPAVLMRRGRRWAPRLRLQAVMIDTAKIVTAFTLAHSVTLTVASLKWVALPSLWVETAIALSIIVVALNNIYPILTQKRWLLAFGFGLIHGFGFATVLGELGVSGSHFMVALLSFNLGVEIGQMAIVVALLPLLFVFRTRWIYRPVVLVGGSACLSLMGAFWVMERLLG